MRTSTSDSKRQIALGGIPAFADDVVFGLKPQYAQYSSPSPAGGLRIIVAVARTADVEVVVRDEAGTALGVASVPMRVDVFGLCLDDKASIQLSTAGTPRWIDIMWPTPDVFLRYTFAETRFMRPGFGAVTLASNSPSGLLFGINQ